MTAERRPSSVPTSLATQLPALWYRPRLAARLLPLLPLSWLFRLLSAARRGLYRSGLLASKAPEVPVIVVGNLTVGGSGKTPLVIWLVEQLRAQGWRPGIISRGYGGEQRGIQSIGADSSAALAGDEPLLLARCCAVPVFVGRDRVAAAEALLAAHPDCNVLVSDDGLQHYRLQRRVELVVFDGRGAGNGHLLPAGPLREPLSRLTQATAVVWNSAPGQRFESAALPQFPMRLEADSFYALHDTQQRCAAADLRGKRLHAIAGIGDPSRFFGTLQTLGLDFVAHAFPDHHAYVAADLDFGADAVLLMTEKDAVKCLGLSRHETWVLPVAAQLEAAPDGSRLLDLIIGVLVGEGKRGKGEG